MAGIIDASALSFVVDATCCRSKYSGSLLFCGIPCEGMNLHGGQPIEHIYFKCACFVPKVSKVARVVHFLIVDDDSLPVEGIQVHCYSVEFQKGNQPQGAGKLKPLSFKYWRTCIK